MKLYLKVTTDKYQLPVAVADNAQELARIAGITKESVYSMISRSERGMNTGYIKVEVEE